MANIIYNRGHAEWLNPATGPGVGTWKWLLERSTSTYSPNKDDDTLLNQSGFVEISVSGYQRQALSGTTFAPDDANDKAVVDCNDVNFGTLASGQTVKAIILARDDGSNYVPFLRIDTDAGGLLPRALGGGNFTVQINANGLIDYAQAT